MESRAKETAKKTAKKGKNGIVKLIFSRIFIFALLIFLQLLVLFYFFWHVNEQFKIFYDFIRIITVFLVLYIVNEKKSDPTMKMIWSIVILIIPIFGALLYLFVKFQPTSVLLRKRLEVINHRSDNYLEYKTDIKDKLQKDDPLIENLGEYIYKYSGCPPYENSKITYFASGEEKYDYLIKKLKEAKSFIFLEYLIIEEGEVWNSVLEILKQKKKGNYNIIEIDPDYVPAALEHKEVFGITFEQGRNELVIDEHFFDNIVTENKEIPDSAKMDLAISMITLKYTQSNSVCYVKGGQAIGIGAGQQSRIHCTRLAGSKADNWWLRQSPQVLGLQFLDKIGRADRDNAIDLYIGEDYMDVLADGAWENIFKVKPEVFTREEKRAWLDKNTDVALGSDAFFPFGDNVERAHKSGVKYIAQPGGSIRDDHVIATCNKYGIAMAFTGIRLFHH